VRRWFELGPATHLTLVPPRRVVELGQLAAVTVGNEYRAARQVLKPLPPGTVAVGWPDIGLREIPGEDRQRFWVPHLHVVVAGLERATVKRLLGSPYRATWLVRQPQHVQRAPTPGNVLAYALKHVDDVMAEVVLRDPARPGRQYLKERWLKPEERAELRAFLGQYRIHELLLLIGVRRFGRTLRRV
jgi:hypothetical protein